MSDELSNATRIAALEADVVRLTAELQGEREDLAEKCKAYGDALVEETKLTTRIAALDDYNQRLLAENVRLSNEAAFMRSFINNEDVRSDFKNATAMRNALDRERERVREWNVLVAQGCTPGGSEFHDCPQNVAYYITERLADKDRIMKSQQKELNRERERCGVLQTALAKINDIRNSIIGFQTVNWSEHIYPLVAALKAAGIDGMAYPEALKNTGTLVEQAKLAIERCGVLEAEVKAWHAAEHLRKDEPHNEFMRLAEARARTRETHALDAAKFVGGG